MSRHRSLRSLVVPLLALAVVAIAAVIHLRRDGPAPERAHERTRASAAAGVQLDVPASWRLAGSARTSPATWSAPDGAHVVTVAAAEYGAASLDAVTRTVMRELTKRPGVRTVAPPAALALGPAPRGDQAVLLRFAVSSDRSDSTPVEVAQVWRRDARAGKDVVATWTSADGEWPIDPRASIPAADVR